MEQRIIDLVHSILCKKHHTHRIEDLNEPRKPKMCYYYLEGQVEHGENMKDHLRYAEELKIITEHLGIQSDGEMTKFINTLLRVAGSATMMEYEWTGSKKILKRALGL